LRRNFLKARAHDQGLEPFLSLSKIAKRLEPSSPGFDPPLLVSGFALMTDLAPI
jgi:hypothetical protein